MGAVPVVPLVPPEELVVDEVPGALTVSSVLRLQAPTLRAAASANATVIADLKLRLCMSVPLSRKIGRPRYQPDTIVAA